MSDDRKIIEILVREPDGEEYELEIHVMQKDIDQGTGDSFYSILAANAGTAVHRQLLRTLIKVLGR